MSGYGEGLYGEGLYGGEDPTGVPILPQQFANASLLVEVAWGAEPASDSTSWSWTDITADVRADPGLEWRMGRADESSHSNPASLSLVLDNSEAAYSLGGNSSNWPNVRRGTPVRVRMNLDDGVGWRTVYLGFADGWTPSWDSVAGTIPVVTLSASGTLRRLSQGASPVVSPLRRAMTATSSVIAYWPMEDGELADVLTPAAGTAAMTFLGEVDLANDTTFHCSSAIPTLGAGSLDTLVDAYTSSAGQHQVRFIAAFPDSPNWPDRAVIARIYTHGTVARWDLQWRTGGGLTLVAFNTDGTQNFDSGNWAFDVNGNATRLSVELLQEGADVGWAVRRLTQFAATGNFIDDTVTGVKATARTITRVTRVELAPDGNLEGLALGHLTVQNVQTSLFEAVGPFNSYNGEGVTNVTSGRIARLCTENDVAYTSYGGTPSTLTLAELMGPQRQATLLELLQDCEDVEQGQLWDGLTAGLAYTTRRRHEDGTVVLTIDAGAGELSPPFEPIDDDQRTRNKVTVTRVEGAEVTYTDTDGPLGTTAIGVYHEAVTVNTFSDGSLLDQAAWRVHRGTVEGYRYPAVTVDLTQNPHLAADVLGLFPGARIDITNIDDALTGMDGETISLTVEGLQHHLTPRTWQVTATCSPWQPWNIAEIPADSGDTEADSFRLDADKDACTLTTAVAQGATSFQVSTASGPLWTTTADDYPFDLDIGGNQVTVTACSGASSPQTFTTAAFPRTLAAGKPVRLYQPPSLGL